MALNCVLVGIIESVLVGRSGEVLVGMVEDVSGVYGRGIQWCWWVCLRVSVVVMIEGVSGSVGGYDQESRWGE